MAAKGDQRKVTSFIDATLARLEAENEELQATRLDLLAQRADLLALQDDLSSLRSDSSLLASRLDAGFKFHQQTGESLHLLLNSLPFKFARLLTKLGKLIGAGQADQKLQKLVKVVSEGTAWTKQSSHDLHRINARPDAPLSGFRGRLEQDRYAGEGKETQKLKASVDVVVCVYNALEEVRECVEHLCSNTAYPFRLILVDDASEAPTARYLDTLTVRGSESVEPSVAARYGTEIVVLRNETNLGYTRSANRGLKFSSSQKVVLLNSDTRVSFGWLRKLVEVSETCPDTGLVGPLSNAASFQSVPQVFESGKQGWYCEEPPLDLSSWSALVAAAATDGQVPRVPTLNGFCTLIDRKVFERIGYLDEEKYPIGYGEENDFCLRAEDAGFIARVAPQVFVAHAKSKSFSHERRVLLCEENRGVYEATYGAERIARNAEFLIRRNPLDAQRFRLTQLLETKDITVAYLLPAGAIAGGVISVLQLVKALRCLEVKAFVVVPTALAAAARREFDLGDAVLEVSCFSDFEKGKAPAATLEQLATADVLVATHNSSVKTATTLRDQSKKKVSIAYFVQDYEPWFYQRGSEQFKEASASYTAADDLLLVAKTKFLCKTVEHFHPGLEVEKVPAGLDVAWYRPSFDFVESSSDKLQVVAMVRPKTPRRQPEATVRVLSALHARFKDKIEVHLFGCTYGELLDYDIPDSFRIHGVLRQSEMVKLLRKSDLFLDMSTYQAFGRTGLEAMASGCIPCLPRDGGVTEYAVAGVNSILLDTLDESACVEALAEMVIQSEDTRREMKCAGITAALKFSVEAAAVGHLTCYVNHHRRSVNRTVTIVLPLEAGKEFPSAEHVSQFVESCAEVVELLIVSDQPCLEYVEQLALPSSCELRVEVAPDGKVALGVNHSLGNVKGSLCCLICSKSMPKTDWLSQATTALEEAFKAGVAFNRLPLSPERAQSSANHLRLQGVSELLFCPEYALSVAALDDRLPWQDTLNDFLIRVRALGGMTSSAPLEGIAKTAVVDNEPQDSWLRTKWQNFLDNVVC